jgi:hypothetical protein
MRGSLIKFMIHEPFRKFSTTRYSITALRCAIQGVDLNQLHAKVHVILASNTS